MLRLGLGRLGVSADEARLQAMYADLIAAYEGDIARRTRLYPGAAEAVGRLRASGARVGICTNKPVHLAHALLGALGVREWFHGLIGAGSLPVRKPDPAPLHAAIAASGGHAERACLIGDTDTDRETGRAAGVPVVLVTFGPHGGDVARHAPEALLSDYGDLEATLSRIGR
jgi:phosphoglycolate phosphatase